MHFSRLHRNIYKCKCAHNSIILGDKFKRATENPFRVNRICCINIVTCSPGNATVIVECLLNALFYFAFPWLSYNCSLYNFTTHKLKTLSSDLGILYFPSWQTNIHFRLLNSGLLVVSWRELN
jgi:hypothetical protein